MKVVIGIDDSKHSDEAIGYVARSAWPKGTEFLVLSAVAPIFIGPGEAEAVEAIARLMEEQEEYYSEVAKQAAVRLREAGLTTEARTVLGDPRTALLDTARSTHADLIVVGSHGRTGVKKLLLGSVASHVVTHAPCSVLVVRREGRQGG